MSNLINGVFSFSNFSYDEYFNNWLLVKDFILEDTSLLEKIKQTIDANYSGSSFPKGVFELGSGNNHITYSLDKVLGVDTHLALRLMNVRYNRYFENDFNPFKEVVNEISFFARAYTNKDNPPSFVGLIESEGNFGLITEDISKKNTLPLIDKFGGFSTYLVRSDGVKFYIDPQSNYKNTYEAEICDKYVNSKLLF